MAIITRLLKGHDMDQSNGEWVAANKKLLGKTLLEVGSVIVKGQEGICLRNYISNAVEKYVGIDVRAGNGVDVVGDASNMPFVDNSFDSVVCLDMLEHCKYPHEIFKESFRVTVPGGYLFLATVFDFPVHYHDNDYFRFTHNGLRLMAEDAGYEVIECPQDIELTKPGIVKIIARKPE